MTQTQFIRRAMQTLWFALGLSLIGWILLRNFPLDGKLTVRVHAAEPSGFIGGFLPAGRAKVVRDGGRAATVVTDEPAYFTLAKLPFFERVAVRVHFKDEGQPIVELGGRTSRDVWAFDLRPLDAPLLDGLGWHARQDGKARVYERRASGRDVSEILNASSDGRTAVYHVAPVRWGMRLPLARSRSVDTEDVPAATRRLYVYVDRDPLELEVELGVDETAPKDAVAFVRLVKVGETLLTRSARGGTLDLSLSGAKPGLYRVEIDADAHFSVASIHANQARLVWRDPETGALDAPSKEAAFEPEFPVVTWQTDFSKAPYDTVVADYRPPALGADGFKTAEAEFDLAPLADTRGEVQMVLSLPAIKRVHGSVTVDWIEAEYRRAPLTWDAVAAAFQKALNLLKFRI